MIKNLMIKNLKAAIRRRQAKQNRKRLLRKAKQAKVATRHFTSEEILAGASLPVQNLLAAYQSKANYQQILTAIRTKTSTIKLSDPKTKKQFKLAPTVLWPYKATYRKAVHGPIDNPQTK